MPIEVRGGAGVSKKEYSIGGYERFPGIPEKAEAGTIIKFKETEVLFMFGIEGEPFGIPCSINNGTQYLVMPSCNIYLRLWSEIE